MPAFLTLILLDQRLRRQRYALAIVIFILILLVGSIPGARQEIGLVARGVILHSVAYSLLTLLLFTGTAGTRAFRALTAVATVVAMGAIDELVQSTLSYRVGSFQDWCVDTIASTLTALVLWRFLPDPVGASTP